MLSGVGIICFAASYAIALVLELSRLVFRSGIRGAVMIGWAAAGLLAHSAFLYYRAVKIPGAPLSSFYDWYLLAAWALVVVYLYLAWHFPKTHFGVFLLPLVLGLIATAVYFTDPQQPFARGPASQVWGVIHGMAILLATVAVLVGFVAGTMYLGQAWRLKHKRAPWRGLRLPSLEWLQRANSRAIGVSLAMLGAGVFSGFMLNLINYRHGEAVLPWNDPLVLGTLGMFAWLLIAAAVGALYRPARQGSKVAWLTVASFLFLVIALAMGLMMNTQHGGKRDQVSGGAPRGTRGAGRRVGGQELQIENCKLQIANCRRSPGLQFAIRNDHASVVPESAICNGGSA